MRTLALFMVCALTTGVACGKDDTPPETIPFKELTAQPTPAPKDDDTDSDDSDGNGAPEEDSSGGSAATAQPTPSPPSTGSPAPGPRLGGGNIDNCCGALSLQARLDKDPTQAARLKQAAGVCASISSMVKTGKTTRESALRQVRAMAGGKAPGNCY